MYKAITGVYIITESSTNKHYIGCSSDVEKKLQDHKFGRTDLSKSLDFSDFELKFELKIFYFDIFSRAKKAQTELLKNIKGSISV